MVNPMVVEGQTLGGMAQGIGTALYEETPYDANGQPLASTMMDYLMPAATEVPPIRIHHLETPSPYTKFGIKGMGEGGAIAPAGGDLQRGQRRAARPRRRGRQDAADAAPAARRDRAAETNRRGRHESPRPSTTCGAHSIAEALSAMRDAGAAKALAGGQSLGPMLNLRLARPKLLVDVGRMESLRAIEDGGTFWRIGASVTHSALEDAKLPGGEALSAVARGIAYRAVRNRGTIGGSLAHADPAADWPLALAALGATLRVAGPSGPSRTMRAHTFMTGALRNRARRRRVDRLDRSAEAFARPRAGAITSSAARPASSPRRAPRCCSIASGGASARGASGALNGAPTPLPGRARRRNRGAAALAAIA